MAENVLKIVHEGLTNTGEGGASGSSSDVPSNAAGLGKAIAGGIAAGAVGGGILLIVDILLKIFPIFEILAEGMSGFNESLGVVIKLFGMILRPFLNLFIPIFLLFAYILMPWVKLMNLLLTPLLIIMMQFVKAIGPKFSSWLETSMPLFISIAQWMAELVEAVMSGDFGKIWELLFGAGETLVGYVLEAFVAAIPFIQGALSSIWDGIKDIKIGEFTIEEWVEKFKTTLQGAWDFVSGLFSFEEGEENPLVAFIKDPIGWILENGIPLIGEAMALLINILIMGFNFFRDVFYDNLVKAVGMLLETIKMEIAIFKEDILIGFAEFFIKILSQAQSTINDIISAYNSVASIVGSSPITFRADFSGMIGGLQDFSRSASARKTELLQQRQEVTNNITVNGDISGEELINKIQTLIDQKSNELLGENGVLSS